MWRDGVMLPLAPTHGVLVDFAVASRPTASGALLEVVRRDPIESWLFRGDPRAKGWR